MRFILSQFIQKAVYPTQPYVPLLVGKFSGRYEKHSGVDVPWPWLAILALLVAKGMAARLAKRLPIRPAVRWSIWKKVSGDNTFITYTGILTAHTFLWNN